MDRSSSKRILVFSIIFLTALMARSSAFGYAGALQALKGAEGNWQGVLDVGAVRLRIIVKVSKAADGSLAATIDSPDQGAMNLPINSFTQRDDAVAFEMKLIGASFEGTLNKEGTELSGRWSQGGQSWPLNFKRLDKPAEASRPQDPKRPYPYDEEEVAYENKAAGIKLAGTLTLPRAKNPFVTVLLITGSGPQDRDESLLGHRPFLVLADHLARRGIAVLRVDDRGVGGSTGDFTKATTQDFASDVLAGIEYLKSRKEVDARRIGLIGHSEGGVVAPMVATRSPDVAFIVMMAGTGLTGEEILLEQAALIARATGANDLLLEKNRAMQEAAFAILKSEKDDQVAKKKIREAYAAIIAGVPAERKAEAAALAKAGESQLSLTVSPWFRYFLTYDPRPTLKEVKVPVLAINGEKDLQVPPKANLAAIAAALEAGGNKSFKTIELPNLNHLFQTSRTGSPAEYARITETISPAALELISDWILKQTGSK